PDGTRLLIAHIDGSTNGRTRWFITPASGGAEVPLPHAPTETMAFWTDPTTVAIGERLAAGWRLSLLDVRSNTRRATVTTPDSTMTDFTPLENGGWAWLPASATTIAIQPAGATAPRRVPVPPWYIMLTQIGSSPDGTKVWIVGWSAPA